MTKTVLLSFDLEEFDLPEEFKQEISNQEKIEISLSGLTKVLKLLNSLNIKATFFTTAVFALKYPKIIKEISRNHEISCHGYEHNDYNNLEKAKKTIEKIINKKIFGYRAPRLKKPDFQNLKKIGFTYDSSINPTFLPSRYNNLNEKRTHNIRSEVIEIPISTLPICRFPLFWISFKILPKGIFRFFSKITMSKDKYLNLFFHPWEFTDISKFKVPFYIKMGSGEKMAKKLKNYLFWCKKNGFSFKTFSEFINLIS